MERSGCVVMGGQHDSSMEWEERVDTLVDDFVKARQQRSEAFLSETRRELAMLILKSLSDSIDKLKCGEANWERTLHRCLTTEKTRKILPATEPGALLKEIDSFGELHQFVEQALGSSMAGLELQEAVGGGHIGELTSTKTEGDRPLMLPFSIPIASDTDRKWKRKNVFDQEPSAPPAKRAELSPQHPSNPLWYDLIEKRKKGLLKR
ncbi:hypothetical protein QBC33DRAFT_512008 [Phialemonium atrogriseum]|uniref:Uncharacterized protein n=1 Tax=Phialemonium atrogriseum TaxID=1093897 RepID=A0AAJ0C9L1_9PEZI|nr:uncharacterized protein QBC33DRAFT_512008 [Phialemonium atrogriseum]KAK1771232.1 hypothetical protein QBC33DRAFT_512008 [Phialemonium atrogriseum]